MKRKILADAADASIRTLDDGRTVFYPMGPFGRRGFVIDSPETEARLRTAARRWTIGNIAVCLALSAAIGLGLPYFFGVSFTTQNGVAAAVGGGVVLLIIVQLLAMRVYYAPLTKGLEPVSIPNATGAQLAKAFDHMPPWFMRAAKYYMTAVALASAVVGVVWLNVFALVLAACCAPIAAVYWYAEKGRVRAAGESTRDAS